MKGKNNTASKATGRKDSGSRKPAASATKEEKPTPPAKADKTASPDTAKRVTVSTTHAKPVERVDEELKMIKRYALLHGTEKTADQILNFINALQRAIVEKRIRKTSPYAQQIRYIQNTLIKFYNKMKGPTKITIRESILDEMLAIAGSEKVRLSIAYLKRYI